MRSIAEPSVTPDGIMQLGLGFWGSKTLLSAIELGVFSRLASGPMDGETLEDKLGLHSRSRSDFWDALVALRILQRDGEHYANTPPSDLFLDPEKPSYIDGILEMANARLYLFWGSLTEALQTRKPQNESKIRRKSLRCDLQHSGTAPRLPAGDDRSQPRSRPGHRGEVSVG